MLLITKARNVQAYENIWFHCNDFKSSCT